MTTAWQPSLGAIPTAAGTRFSVWAPAASTLDLVVESGAALPVRPLDRHDDGIFRGTFADLPPGTRYRYRVNGAGPFPDPASRYQPDGVHGASMVVDPHAFQWHDQSWRGVSLPDLVIYELHVGTFSDAGTFAGVTRHLDALSELGVTAIELMPIAQFAGTRNWGYDGAALFAPANSYGTPEDLRRLIDAAHARGLAVLLDVVYNHFGPDGAYVHQFSPQIFTRRHQSPWGAGINLDGEHSRQARDFLIDNALHWIHEYHVDGLRLDATHTMRDASPRHFLAELAERVHDAAGHRHGHVIAEDDRNLALIVLPPAAGGWGLDAVWADDLHHELRRALAGDADGYFRDYRGTTADMATTIRQGWFFTGQFATHLKAPRGTDPAGVPPQRFVCCLQNHDQVGNRAFGERLHHQIDPAAYRAASVLLCLLPQTPLLFMGQEWAASTPFCYFTDHHAELGRLVTEGRRREFAAFAAFADPVSRTAIPDPQADATFAASKLVWRERDLAPHAQLLRLYTELLRWRRDVLSPASTEDAASAVALGPDALGVHRVAANGDPVLVVVRFRGAGPIDVTPLAAASASAWTVALTSEDEPFCTEPAPPFLEATAPPVIHFAGPAGVILRGTETVEDRAA